MKPCCGGEGLAPWFPGKVFTINSRDQFKAIAYRNDWKNAIDPPDAHYISDIFQKNFENHGALSNWYLGPQKNRHRTLEGDSPSFMHILPIGLRSLEDPSYGGWGGRFKPSDLDSMHYDGASDMDADLESRLYKPMSRWYEGSQNDYAARCDWAITSSYDSANHEPVVWLDHPNDMEVTADSLIQLSAVGSWDPDGDQLNYSWWQYKDVDTYEGKVEINNPNSQQASFIFPKEASGKNIHIILEVQDNGSPKMTRYQRVIINGKE